jgi:peptidoglycan/LPS O-acetylase OafA/YrhL
VSAAGKVHFEGLNSLRFFAAFFVVLGHIPLNQASVGLPHPSWGTFFFRGAFAVCFFFALSGFLITYLLLEEDRQTGDINVRRFYLRRICRIWPLYFAVVFFGLFFYNGLLPLLGVHYRVEYGLATALLLYSALLPNLMNSLYTVGGLLNPTWSIGIEEQFYLLWAPTVRQFRGRLPALCWAVLGTSLALFCLNHYDAFSLYPWKGFVGQLKFHYLAAGALCAWWLRRRREALLRLPPFASRTVQLLLFALLLDFYMTSFIPWRWLGEEVLQLVIYCWLIVNVAANPANVVPVGARAFDYLGTISYGIYMLHMPAIYATSALFRRTVWWHGKPAMYCLAYYGLVFGLTFLLAHLSYRWFERPFLRLKDRRFANLSANTTADPTMTPDGLPATNAEPAPDAPSVSRAAVSG